MRRLVLAGLFLTLVAPAMAQAPAAKAPPPPAGAQNSSFNLVNRSPVPIRELFVTAAGNANWGQNRLDGRNGAPTTIAAGGSYAVRRRLDTNCVFDIKVIFADGKAEERKAINTCAVEDVSIGAPPPGTTTATGPGGKPADDPSVKLFNRAARPLTEFHATPSGAGAAGPNRLDTPLAPDGSRQVVIARDGNCIFDLRVVFADGRAMEKRKTNLCRIAELPVP